MMSVLGEFYYSTVACLGRVSCAKQLYLQRVSSFILAVRGLHVSTFTTSSAFEHLACVLWCRTQGMVLPIMHVPQMSNMFDISCS